MSNTVLDNKEVPEWRTRQERGSVFWLRVITFIALKLGRRVARLLLPPITLFFVLRAGEAGDASRAYLARVLKRPTKWIDVYRHFYCFAATILDRIFLVNERVELFDIRGFGTERFTKRFKANKGGLLLGAHIGSFDAVRAFGYDMPSLKVALAMFEGNARKLGMVLNAINPRAAQEIIPLGTMQSILDIRARVVEGAYVGMLADRSLGQKGYKTVSFLGGEAQVAIGPFKIGALLGGPLFFMAAIYRGGNRYDIMFDTLVDFDAAEPKPVLIDRAIARYAEILEERVIDAPYNWFNFFDFWQAEGTDDESQ